MRYAGLIAVGVALMVLSTVTAEPKVTNFNLPHVDNKKGEKFELKFSITSDETTNYTIKLQNRTEFSYLKGTEITTEIPKNDSRTFVFELENAKDLEDGRYTIQWWAYKNGSKFDEGSVKVMVGKQEVSCMYIPVIVFAAAIPALIFVSRK
ncbi:MAG: hypothetical protein DRN14_06260 [Thermoplasmata archaeon]|nr:MAG: hypothetical protein DRN14_06260 [Thermoplasmata archaeon]